MIKIEFKEAERPWQNGLKQECMFIFTQCYHHIGKFIKAQFDWNPDYMVIDTDYVAGIYSEYNLLNDPYLDRSFILQQLGISKEQDEQMQLKYKNL